MGGRINHGYRTMAPSKFHAFNQGPRKAIASGKIPASVWGANPELPVMYLRVSETHDEVFHEAKHGSDLAIAQRDALVRQLIEYLDEIAAVLEAAANRVPDLLLISGFELTKERRSTPRVKQVTAAHETSTGEHEGSNQ